MKKIVSWMILTLLFLSMCSSAFNVSFVKAVEDPMISGIVRDKVGNPIPDVLIVAQNVSTEVDVASATSGATGAYAMSVPPGIYNFIVTPPPESGFASTTISNIEVTKDTAIDIVLVPAETFTFSGLVVNRESNPLPNVYVSVYSAAISKSTYTNEQGSFSLQVPPDLYSLQLSGWYYAPNRYESFWLYKSASLNITEDTFVSFTLQNRYLAGKVVDPYGNPVANVSIEVYGWTYFDDLSGNFNAWTISDSQGEFNVTGFTSTSVSLRATPPPEIPYGPVTISINLTDDTTVTVTLAWTVTLSGLVVDRHGNPMSNVYISVYSPAISKSTYTYENGSFSLNVPPDQYSLQLSGWYYAPNLYESFWLYKATALNITEDTFVTFSLENRFLSGEVLDPDGNYVANVSIEVYGWTYFDDLSGNFNAWTISSNEGKFNVTVFTSTSVSIKATPPPENPYGPVSTTINVTEDAQVTIILAQTVTFSGLVVDRDGRAMPNVYVSVYSAAMSKSTYTDEQGLFSMRVTPDSYSVQLSGWYYAPNLYQSFWLYKATALNITQDASITFTLQNRFLTGKIDSEGKAVANVSIEVYGWTYFDDLSGNFNAWTISSNEGKFNVTVFTSTSVSIRATPPPESIYAPVSLTNIDVTDDKMVLIALFYKAGVLPTANFTWSPEILEVGQTITFDASTSIAGSGIIIRHKWSFGDGTYAIGKIVSHSYSSPGIYTVTLNVTNSKGLWSIIQKEIEVVEPAPGPKSPVASFTYSPSNPKVDEDVIFDASASFDPDGQIVSYNWNFGDGSTGEGKIATHSYSKEGNYKVELTVIDNDGKSTSTSKTVTVVKPTPTANRLKILDKYYNVLDQSTGWTESSGFYYLNYEPDGKKLSRSSETINGFTTVDDGDPYPSQCVDFVRVLSHTSHIQTKWWRQGPNVMTSTDIEPGTVIATFQDGRYPSEGGGHVAVFAGFEYSGGERIGFRVFDQNWRTDEGLGVVGKHYIYTWGSGVSDADNYCIVTLEGISVKATCPVDLVVIDPDYLVVSKEFNEIPEAVYIEEDINEDGSLDDYIFIPERKMGEYLITVIPEPGADPTTTYTLEVSSEGITLLLAENVPIGDIPTEPYVLHSTSFEAPPVVTASIDFDPDTLNLKSKGKWITGYIELPEGYDVADIDVSTILLNGTVPVDPNAPTAIGDYDEDGIPDLMVKFDRAAVTSYILGHVDLVELFEERFMTVTLTVTGRLYDGTEFSGSAIIRIMLQTPRYGRFLRIFPI